MQSKIKSLISIIGVVLSIAIFFFPELTLTNRIILFLIILAISLIIILATSYHDSYLLKKELNEIKHKHSALAHQFDNNMTLLNNYKKNWHNIGIYIFLSLTKNQHKNLDIIFELYNKLDNEINDKGEQIK